MITVILVLILILSTASLLLNLYFFRKHRWIAREFGRVRNNLRRGRQDLLKQLQVRQIILDDLGFEKSLPAMGGKAASPDFLLAVANKIREVQPDIVVECGCGLSTAIIAKCLQINGKGHLYSLEHMAQFAEITRRQLVRHDLTAQATVLDAPLKTYELAGRDWQWYDISGLPDGPIDALIVDGPPARIGQKPRYPAGPILIPRLKVDGVILSDDLIRQEEKDVVADWRREFPNLAFEINEDDFEKGIGVGTIRSQE